jgi:hypothetical protein
MNKGIKGKQGLTPAHEKVKIPVRGLTDGDFKWQGGGIGRRT